MANFKTGQGTVAFNGTSVSLTASRVNSDNAIFTVTGFTGTATNYKLFKSDDTEITTDLTWDTSTQNSLKCTIDKNTTALVEGDTIYITFSVS